jgi:hypothetical protein
MPPPDGDVDGGVPSSLAKSREDERTRLERILPEVVRKVVEAGLDKLSEGPENVRQRLGDLKLPKDALAGVLSQIDESKTGLYRALAKELRDFLESTNFADELVRALTTLSFEIKTEVRLVPNDSGKPRPNVKSNVRVRRGDDRKSSPPPEEEEENP